jgi:ribosomal peptide maturation radical SAM protein 1
MRRDDAFALLNKTMKEGSLILECAPSPPGGKERVLLLSMPFGPIYSPSLGLSSLKGVLTERQIPCDILYFNLKYCQAIGALLYQQISDNEPSGAAMLGEWIFSPALYGGDIRTSEQFYSEILEPLKRRAGTLHQSWSESVVASASELRRSSTDFIKECHSSVAWNDYAVVGFTSVFQQHVASLALARAIKASHPHVHIVFGGANLEGPMGEATQRSFPFVDHVISGEAERTFPRLLSRLVPEFVSNSNGSKPAPPVSFEVLNKTVDDQHLIADLDSLPIPDFDDYFAQVRDAALPDEIRTRLLFESARGCWWGERSHCIFCGLNGTAMRFRSKSPQRVLDELKFLQERHQVSKVHVVDNIMDHEYFKTLLPELVLRNFGLSLFYEIKANLNRSQVELLAKSGIHGIQPGIEALDTDSLRILKKGVTALHNICLLKWGREFELTVAWTWLIDIPGDSEAINRRGQFPLSALYHLQPPAGAAKVEIHRFSPLFETLKPCNSIRPISSYRHIYAFDEGVIAELAYHFELVEDPNLDVLDPLPGIIAAWQKAFSSSSLIFFARSGQYQVIDTRPCSNVALRSIERRTFQLLQYLDIPRTLGDIRLFASASDIFSEEEVVSELESLIGYLYVLNIDRRYVSLAICKPSLNEKSRQRLYAMESSKEVHQKIANSAIEVSS